MTKICYVTDLIQKVVDNSFFVQTKKGIYRIVSGNLFGCEGKYFFVEDVLKGILALVEICNSYNIDLDALHDYLYPLYIDDEEILEDIKQKSLLISE